MEAPKYSALEHIEHACNAYVSALADQNHNNNTQYMVDIVKKLVIVAERYKILASPNDDEALKNQLNYQLALYKYGEDVLDTKTNQTIQEKAYSEIFNITQHAYKNNALDVVEHSYATLLGDRLACKNLSVQAPNCEQEIIQWTRTIAQWIEPDSASYARDIYENLGKQTGLWSFYEQSKLSYYKSWYADLEDALDKDDMVQKIEKKLTTDYQSSVCPTEFLLQLNAIEYFKKNVCEFSIGDPLNKRLIAILERYEAGYLLNNTVPPSLQGHYKPEVQFKLN